MQGFLHGRVAELELLLHEMYTQQCLHSKRLLARPAVLGRAGLYQSHQLNAGIHQCHGVLEFALGVRLAVLLRPKLLCFMRVPSQPLHAHLRPIRADLP